MYLGNSPFGVYTVYIGLQGVLCIIWYDNFPTSKISGIYTEKHQLFREYKEIYQKKYSIIYLIIILIFNMNISLIHC